MRLRPWRSQRDLGHGKIKREHNIYVNRNYKVKKSSKVE